MGLRVGMEFHNVLESFVHDVVWRAGMRAKMNGRKTLRPQDL